MTLKQGIHEFIVGLELTDAQVRKASDQHIFLRESLSKELALDPDYNSFLTGSYSRSTAIRPLNDIDFFCVMLPNADCDPTKHDPSVALDVIEAALKKIYPANGVRRQSRSVNIEFTETGIAYDVVPAFRDRSYKEEVFQIPDLKKQQWLLSNPKVHIQKSVAANAATQGELKRLIKAAKHWNRLQPEAAQLRSFHLEVMACKILTAKPDSSLQGLIDLFDGLAKSVFQPTPEPARLGPNLDDDLSSTDRERASKAFAAAAARLKDAKRLAADGRTEEAHYVLRQLFGDAYPERGRAPSVATSSAAVTSFVAPDSPSGRFG